MPQTAIYVSAPDNSGSASLLSFKRPAFDQPKQVQTGGGLTQKGVRTEGSGDDSSSEEDDAILEVVFHHRAHCAQKGDPIQSATHQMHG